MAFGAVDPPAAVKNSIKDFIPPPDTVLKPRCEQKSIIFDWGARLEYMFQEKMILGWACMQGSMI